MLDNILCGNAMGDYSLENKDSAVIDVAVLFGSNSRELWTKYMASRGFTEVHRILLRNHDNDSSLWDSLRSLEDHDMLSAVIDRVDSQGRSPLAWAVEYGWAHAVDTLISFGANPHQVRRSAGGGEAPLLHLAIAGPISSRSCEVVRVLLGAGIDVNARDEEQWTAVHIAASWNLHDVVKAILEKQPDLSAVTVTDDTALDLAVRAEADSPLVKLLQEHMDI
jgi:ankyrin repeat protein